MCGEKTSLSVTSNQTGGSPPHVRGKGKRRISSKNGFRITPACAGKRSDTLNPVAMHRDHPRMCGEKGDTTSAQTTPPGSPPHVRGKVEGYLSSQERRRITPACAGKRFRCFMPWQIRRDHPRMCGEKVFFILSPLYIVGSPPHVRGKAVTPRW